MAKGPHITNEVRILIAKLHEQHPKWTNTMIRNEVLSIVHKGDPSLPKDWPSKHSIDRIMPEIRYRARLRKLKPTYGDLPWTIQSMTTCPIPPEALPSVLRVWFAAREKGRALSIRDAEWVSRLYAAIDNVESLYSYSRLLSMLQKLADISGIESFMGTPQDNLCVFSIMTGYVVTHQDLRMALGWPDDKLRQLEEVWPLLQGVVCDSPLGEVIPVPGVHYEWNEVVDETRSSLKEAQGNERKHKAEE